MYTYKIDCGGKYPFDFATVFYKSYKAYGERNIILALWRIILKLSIENGNEEE